MPRLSNDRYEKFARFYVQHHDTRRAATQVGMAPRTGEFVVRYPQVAERIRELNERALTAADITGQRVMLELARVAFSDVRGIFDERGALKPIHEIDDDTAAGLAGVEFEEKIIREVEEDLVTGEMVTRNVPIRTAKIKRYDKNPALLTLAKHFKLVGDEGDGVNALASALADRLKLARKRVDVIEAEEVQQPLKEIE